jgi:hypothetical protein
MFGMEKEKKKKGDKKQELVFDLEKDIVSDPENYKAIKQKVQGRVKDLKQSLRSGADKEHFDKYGLLLHGYVSLKKVIERVHKRPR